MRREAGPGRENTIRRDVTSTPRYKKKKKTKKELKNPQTARHLLQ